VPEYGIGQDFETIKGKRQPFTWKLDGARWHHVGTW
jgi:hypothetical protein